MEKEMAMGFCGKEEITILGTKTCRGTIIARERHPDDNKSLKYSVQCDSCLRWWETENVLLMITRWANKLKM